MAKARLLTAARVGATNRATTGVRRAATGRAAARRRGRDREAMLKRERDVEEGGRYWDEGGGLGRFATF
jgi:hypothetical protein